MAATGEALPDVGAELVSARRDDFGPETGARKVRPYD